MKNGRAWGQDSWTCVSWKRVGRAAYNSALDLQFLIPAAGALMFTIDDFDRRTYNWANGNHPLFGSADSARLFSDYARYALVAEPLATGMLSPGGDDRKDWMVNKAKGISVDSAAFGLGGGAVLLLKETTNRKRPDERDDLSFPSGHAALAFSGAILSNNDLNTIPMNGALRRSFQALNLLLATGVSWARVESGEHYPSDVLGGAAIGYFFSSFIHDAFLGSPEEDRFGFVVVPMKGGVMGGVSIRH